MDNFPKPSPELRGRKDTRIRKSAEEEMKALGLSRQQRRAKSRTLIKNGKPRSTFSALLTQQNKNTITEEIFKKYPMHPKYIEIIIIIIINYVLGQATEKDFYETLMGSLVDPCWMMKWFTTEHAISSPIADMIRKPGREIGQLMRSLVEVLVPLAISLRDSSLGVNPTSRNREIALQWQEMEAHQLISITQRLANTIGIELDEYSARDVRTFYLGITAAIGSLYSSVWENIGGGRKEKPSDSQPIDALHASYAPYIQTFRADRFMAPHIQKQTKNVGTIVVSQLSQLVDILKKQIH